MPRPFCVVVATLVAALSAAQAAETPHRPESQQEYWAQIDRKDWSAAIAAAEQLVATARTQRHAAAAGAGRGAVAAR